MTIFDWYILRLFAKIFLVCFVSLSGLFVIVHVFTNLDEVVNITQEIGGPKIMAQQFYVPRIFLFFDQTAALLILVAAIFSFTLLQRNNEITALEAAGVSRARIVRPLFLGAFFIIMFSFVNREVLLPKHRSSLVRNAQTWSGDKEQPMPFQIDQASGIMLRGNKIIPAKKTIVDPEFQIPFQTGDIRRASQVSAEFATFKKENRNHPEGYLVRGVTSETTTLTLPDPDENSNHSPIVYASDQFEWLSEDECFVACSMSTDEIVYGRQMRRYSGLPELISNAKNPSIEFSNHQRVDIHSRIVRPFLDMAVLMLGLPLVVSRRDRNLFLVAAMCLGVIILMQLVMTGSHALGAMRLIKPAALAAWAPMIVFLPWSLTAVRQLKN